VHVAVGDVDARPGDIVTSVVTQAAPHHLVADAGVLDHRQWRGEAAPASSHSTRVPIQIGRRPA
jgi:tRNA-2-methylthio-N6-dimethylallyladenosine synthase